MKKMLGSLILLLGLNMISKVTFAHCDTKDGPVVLAAIKAIEKQNLNYALIWVQPEQETELKEAFEIVMKVRVLNKDAEKLADNYFYETIVRLHRTGENMPFTGVKPAGTPIDSKILAADRAIENGNLSSLVGLVPKERQAELKKLFNKVMALKQYDVNNVQEGRKYVEAYVHFFHFAEGEGVHNPSNKNHMGH